MKAESEQTPTGSETSSSETEQPSNNRYALSSYSEELLPKPLAAALRGKGYQTLTEVQDAVVEADADHSDLRITSKTGSGKTVAVGLSLGRHILGAGSRNDTAASAEERRAPRVLVLTPTRELASQVQRELVWLFADVPDARVEVVTGGTSVGMERKNLARGPRIVVGTPGRVLDHLDKGGFSGGFISQVVLDEADQMLDMGFRDELSGILDQLPKERSTHLVSATFAGEVLRIADQYQRSPRHIFGSALGAANEDIEHIAHVVGFRHRYDALVNLLLKAEALADEDERRTLVFTRTRADTLEVAERLQRDGIRAESLSGDLAQAQRTRTLSAFRSGSVSTLIATDVAARGLDVVGVDLVIHYDPPGDTEAFTHRSGRTGRAGRKGTSVMLLPPQARGRMERMLRAARVSPQWAPAPDADKIRKLYSKIAKRRLYAALEKEPTETDLSYAKKLLQEHDAEKVVAQLLSLHDVRPPCAPKEISDHMGHEHKKGRRDHRETDRGRPPHRFGHSAGKPPRGGENYGGDRPDQESSARRGFGGPRGQGRRGNQGGRRFRP